MIIKANITAIIVVGGKITQNQPTLPCLFSTFFNRKRLINIFIMLNITYRKFFSFKILDVSINVVE